MCILFKNISWHIPSRRETPYVMLQISMLRNSTNKTFRPRVRVEEIQETDGEFYESVLKLYTKCYLNDVSSIGIFLKIKMSCFDMSNANSSVCNVFRIEETKLVCVISRNLIFG